MSEHIHKPHNVLKLMYHFVLLAKYRRVVIDEKVDNVIKETLIKCKILPVNTYHSAFHILHVKDKI